MGQRGEGLPRRDQARRRYQSLISRPDLPHLLGGNGLFIDLAAHEHAHPSTRLASWRPAAAYHERGAFFRPGADPRMVGSAKGLPRPDGAGVWAEDGRTVPFFVEYDTGKERLDILTDKVDKYALLFAYAQSWAWPVLFVLPTVLREQHWHDRLTATYQRPPAGDRHHRRRLPHPHRQDARAGRVAGLRQRQPTTPTHRPALQRPRTRPRVAPAHPPRRVELTRPSLPHGRVSGCEDLASRARRTGEYAPNDQGRGKEKPMHRNESTPTIRAPVEPYGRKRPGH